MNIGITQAQSATDQLLGTCWLAWTWWVEDHVSVLDDFIIQSNGLHRCINVTTDEHCKKSLSIVIEKVGSVTYNTQMEQQTEFLKEDISHF